jgi:hypothetical protein
VALLEPNGGGEAGYITLRGSAEQLAAVREDEEFRRNMADASLIVKNLCICMGSANEGVAKEVAVYQEAIARVPQMA